MPENSLYSYKVESCRGTKKPEGPGTQCVNQRKSGPAAIWGGRRFIIRICGFGFCRAVTVCQQSNVGWMFDQDEAKGQRQRNADDGGQQISRSPSVRLNNPVERLRRDERTSRDAHEA